LKTSLLKTPFRLVGPPELMILRMATRCILACLLLSSEILCFAADAIHIETRNGTAPELQTKAQLEKILTSYDLNKYTFTRNVVIDQQAIPHSHPVLTLHTRHLNSDDQLLSTYVHEQLHWYLDAHSRDTQAAEADLRKIYPHIPVGYPDGAQDEESTYLHLIDCYLEMRADRELMGDQPASEVMKFWAGDHYRWIYRTVLADEAKIAEVVQREHLDLWSNGKAQHE
jgi:hypothetical protein